MMASDGSQLQKSGFNWRTKKSNSLVRAFSNRDCPSRREQRHRLPAWFSRCLSANRRTAPRGPGRLSRYLPTFLDLFHPLFNSSSTDIAFVNSQRYIEKERETLMNKIIKYYLILIAYFFEII